MDHMRKRVTMLVEVVLIRLCKNESCASATCIQLLHRCLDVFHDSGSRLNELFVRDERGSYSANSLAVSSSLALALSEAGELEGTESITSLQVNNVE
jgi:hypothetical protein